MSVAQAAAPRPVQASPLQPADRARLVLPVLSRTSRVSPNHLRLPSFSLRTRPHALPSRTAPATTIGAFAMASAQG